jgi:uncharacterized Rmd1/YagE family protein
LEDLMNSSYQENFSEQSVPLLKRQAADDSTNAVRSPFDSLRRRVPTLQNRSTFRSPLEHRNYGSALTQENLQRQDLLDDSLRREAFRSQFNHAKPLDLKSNLSVDDFAETNSVSDFKISSHHHPNKAIRSGRQRKKTAARSKGGEFQAKRKKRRIYFCSIGSEIDVEGLADSFSHSAIMGLRGKMYSEVLHLYIENIPEAPKEEKGGDDAVGVFFDEDHHHDLAVVHEGDEEAENINPIASVTDDKLRASHDSDINGSLTKGSITHEPSLGYDDPFGDDKEEGILIPVTSYDQYDSSHQLSLSPISHPRQSGEVDDRHERRTSLEPDHPHHLENHDNTHFPASSVSVPLHVGEDDEIIANSHYWSNGGREVFVFDFGAIVFWGYHRDEVKDLLKLFRGYIVKGELSKEEFEAGEDDMAFVLSSDVNNITISNDVITLPEITSVKSRLALSFAIAQSTILAIFEARIEEKIEDYKYIPETLAISGKIKLSAKQLGNMIGEVFVIRHDVNLHNEILNIPDYFWKENAVEPLYRMMSLYLEMEPRTEVLNKRLDLLRELLKLLQHQHENSHNIKLEWIIIWLIVISVILELFVMIGKLFRLWD